MKRISSAALLFLVAFHASPASAVKSREVMEKMDQKQRFGYVTGLVDMLSYEYVLAGDRPHGQCIANAFYSKEEKTWEKVYEAMRLFPDKSLEAIIVVLMNKKCGK